MCVCESSFCSFIHYLTLNKLYSERKTLGLLVRNDSNHLLVYGMGTNEINLCYIIRSSASTMTMSHYSLILKFQTCAILFCMLKLRAHTMSFCVETKTLMSIMWCTKIIWFKVYSNYINLFCTFNVFALSKHILQLISIRWLSLKFYPSTFVSPFQRSFFHLIYYVKLRIIFICVCMCEFVISIACAAEWTYTYI